MKAILKAQFNNRNGWQRIIRKYFRTFLTILMLMENFIGIVLTKMFDHRMAWQALIDASIRNDAILIVLLLLD